MPEFDLINAATASSSLFASQVKKRLFLKLKANAKANKESSTEPESITQTPLYVDRSFISGDNPFQSFASQVKTMNHSTTQSKGKVVVTNSSSDGTTQSPSFASQFKATHLIATHK